MAGPSRILHPTLTPEERTALFRQGIDLFNRGEFFEAHEFWEEIWRSTTPEPPDLFQGLIQVAAALHQILDLGRSLGPRRTLAKARQRLEPFAPASHGLDLKDLLLSVESWQDWLNGTAEERPALPFLRMLDVTAVR